MQDSYFFYLKQFHCRKGKGTRILRVGEVFFLKETNIKLVSRPMEIVTDFVFLEPMVK